MRKRQTFTGFGVEEQWKKGRRGRSLSEMHQHLPWKVLEVRLLRALQPTTSAFPVRERTPPAQRSATTLKDYPLGAIDPNGMKTTRPTGP